MVPRRAISSLPARLKLHVLDAEDLACLSMHLQDALVRVGDLAFLPEQRRFALVGSRFDWAAQASGRHERCCAGVHFECVKSVRHLRVARERPDAILELLALVYEPGSEPPEGFIRLIFAGGAAILLEVECVEAQLCDLGPRWSTKACPSHELDEAAGGGS